MPMEYRCSCRPAQQCMAPLACFKTPPAHSSTLLQTPRALAGSGEEMQGHAGCRLLPCALLKPAWSANVLPGPCSRCLFGSARQQAQCVTLHSRPDGCCTWDGGGPGADVPSSIILARSAPEADTASSSFTGAPVANWCSIVTSRARSVTSASCPTMNCSRVCSTPWASPAKQATRAAPSSMQSRQSQSWSYRVNIHELLQRFGSEGDAALPLGF